MTRDEIQQALDAIDEILASAPEDSLQAEYLDASHIFHTLQVAPEDADFVVEALAAIRTKYEIQ